MVPCFVTCPSGHPSSIPVFVSLPPLAASQGEDKYTFIEEVQNPLSVTILLKGPNKHTLTQLKDAVHDGLRAVKNAIEDRSVVPGGGAFEVAVNAALTSPEFMNSVQGRVKYGVKVSV